MHTLTIYDVRRYEREHHALSRLWKVESTQRYEARCREIDQLIFELLAGEKL